MFKERVINLPWSSEEDPSTRPRTHLHTSAPQVDLVQVCLPMFSFSSSILPLPHPPSLWQLVTSHLLLFPSFSPHSLITSLLPISSSSLPRFFPCSLPSLVIGFLPCPPPLFASILPVSPSFFSHYTFSMSFSSSFCLDPSPVPPSMITVIYL